MYSQAAIQLRRCTGTRKDGRPCRAWALWDDPRQLCMAHAGRHHRGPMPPYRHRRSTRGKYISCRCEAYAWPHRPGSGLCEWPNPPRYRSTIPAGTRFMGLPRERRR